ncbi:MAG: hypothetical protein WCW13_01970 [archaeon]|jgi:hypothetical protein
MIFMGKNILEKVFGFNFFLRKIIELKWLVISFFIFLIAQVWQISLLPWDSIAYVFQGKWFCGQQIYLELLRPPLPGVVNCLFGAQVYSMLLSTALACVIYFAAIVYFYVKEKKVDQLTLALYALLFPFILFASNFGGDLFAVAFLLWALLIESPWKKGVLFALASLSRYNFLIYAVLFLWQMRKDLRKIGWFVLPIILLWLPWLIFNYLFTGNPFFSINESSFLNVLYKGIWALPTTDQVIFFVFFLIVAFFSKLQQNLNNIKNQAVVIGWAQFIISGIKENRFALVVVPLMAFNISKICAIHKNLKLVFIVLILLFLGAATMQFYLAPGQGGSFEDVYGSGLVPTDSFLKNCRLASDKWVWFYPQGIVAETLADMPSFDYFLARGGNIVLYNYKNIDLNGFNVINRGDYVILKSSFCTSPPKKYISGSLRNYVIKWLKDTNSTFYDYSDWVGYPEYN